MELPVELGIRQNDPVFRRVIAQDKRRRLMQSRPNFQMYFSRSQVAASLWDYGEDVLADQALDLIDEDLRRVQAIAADYEDPSYPLPVTGQRITHNHVTAFAAITFFEGQIRPLKRTRRRPQRVSRLGERAPIDPQHVIVDLVDACAKALIHQPEVGGLGLGQPLEESRAGTAPQIEFKNWHSTQGQTPGREGRARSGPGCWHHHCRPLRPHP